jgi:hypothetical protein
MGRDTVRQGKYSIWVCLASALFMVGLGFFLWGSTDFDRVLIYIVLGILWLPIALIYFERRHFYLIIQAQEQRIAQLERQLPPGMQPDPGPEPERPAHEAQWQPQP